MTDLAELYQEIVLDHNSRPRNFRKPDHSTRSADGFNPLCGDRVTIYLDVDDEDVIRDVAFQGSGCAISRASTSMMTEALKGKRASEAERLFSLFHKQVTDGDSEDGREDLGDLEALAGIREYPSRVKCAVLGWHALKAALENTSGAVSTE